MCNLHLVNLHSWHISSAHNRKTTDKIKKITIVKKLVPSKKPIFELKLASILNQHEDNDNDSDENIHQQEIQQYLSEVREQREELRRHLRKQFSQLCVNGITLGQKPKKCLHQFETPFEGLEGLDLGDFDI